MMSHWCKQWINYSQWLIYNWLHFFIINHVINWNGIHGKTLVSRQQFLLTCKTWTTDHIVRALSATIYYHALIALGPFLLLLHLYAQSDNLYKHFKSLILHLHLLESLAKSHIFLSLLLSLLWTINVINWFFLFIF